VLNSFSTENHAYKIILAAFEIIDFVEQSKNIVVENRINFKVRIGEFRFCCRNCRTKKFAYDIWGDTVNIASHGVKLSYRENQYFRKHFSIS
jgi:class 3 adenylate cyclase